MTKFLDIHPEVAGHVGESTIYDHSKEYPPRLSNLEYEFDDWFGDAIVESFPCFIVTEQLAEALRESKMTGFVFDTVFVTKSPEFDDLYHDKTGPLPNFEWLKIEGVPYRDDMGLDMGTIENWHYRFIVSERALEMFRKFGFNQGQIRSTVEV